MNSRDNKPHQDDGFSRRASAWMTIIGWILFFLLLFMLFTRLINNMNNPNSNLATQNVNGRKEVVLLRNKQGYYVATGAINGQPVVFMLDTGATDVSIPMAVAERLGLEKGYAMSTHTANGIGTAYSTRLESVALGEISLRDIRGNIMANAGGDEILLGMSFLKHLELTQKGDELRITQ